MTNALSGKDLTICDVIRVARFGAKVQLTDEKEILQRVLKSHDYTNLRRHHRLWRNGPH
jgi:hypothetical protein